MNAPMATCLYGKLPGHGDFVSRGLERSREAALDETLARSVEQAREEWGPEFGETYASAQPWLFAAAAGTAIVIPSADKVGRLFPLYAATGHRVVLQHLYDTVVEAIAAPQGADDLFEALENLEIFDGGASSEPEGQWFCIDEKAPRLPLCWDEASVTPGVIMA